MPPLSYPTTWANLQILFEAEIRRLALSADDVARRIENDAKIQRIELRSALAGPSNPAFFSATGLRVRARDRLWVITPYREIAATEVEVRRWSASSEQSRASVAVRIALPMKIHPQDSDTEPAKPMTFAQARAARKAKTEAAKVQQAKREAETLQHLRDKKLKAKGRKFCLRVCRDEFGLGPRASIRVWDTPCSGKPAQRRRKPV
jgi:hypothetical protein